MFRPKEPRVRGVLRCKRMSRIPLPTCSIVNSVDKKEHGWPLLDGIDVSKAGDFLAFPMSLLQPPTLGTSRCNNIGGSFISYLGHLNYYANQSITAYELRRPFSYVYGESAWIPHVWLW
jgi:hypothetical protein